jgi:cysteine-rich repeat protein
MKRHFAYAWDSDSVWHENIVPFVWINSISPESWNINQIKNQLDSLPEGKKVIYIPRSNYMDTYISTYEDMLRDNETGEIIVYETQNGTLMNLRGIWKQNGVKAVNQSMDAFFDALSQSGAEIDYFFLDSEIGLSAGEFGFNANNDDANNYWNILNDDPRFDSDEYINIEQRLNETGYIPREARLNDTFMRYWRLDEEEGRRNIEVWHAITREISGEYLNEAIYKPFKKYFSGVAVSDYGHYEYTQYENYRIPSNYWLHWGGDFGSGRKVGTANSRELYGWMHGLQDLDYDGDGNGNEEFFRTTAFNSLRLELNKFILIYKTTHWIDFHPWIARRSWTGDIAGPSRISNDDVWQELLFHLGLYSINDIIFWNPYTDEEDDHYLSNVMYELDYLIAYDFQKANTQIEFYNWTEDYILTTVEIEKANVGKFKLSRLTPELKQDLTLQDHILRDDGETVVVRTGSNSSKILVMQESVIFELLDSNSDAGIWILHLSTYDNPEIYECGDGSLDPYEECDDGNIEDGDGCSSI